MFPRALLRFMIKMPSKKTVDNWGFPCLGYNIGDNGEVTLIWCKTCREFFHYENKNAVHVKGIAAIGSETFIKGTATVKKNNFADHVKKSQTHATAVLRLAEDEKLSQCTSANACSTLGTASGAPKQSTLLPYLQKLSARQRLQLTNKFQLAHFLIGKNKSFKFYGEMLSFEKSVHHVDLGSSYNSDRAAKEIVSYISKSIVMTEITEPLNNNAINYYSILNDGSSSAKTTDEKEIFLIKTAAKGTPKFEVMSLEEPKSCDAEGLKESLTVATGRMNFSFPRSQKELGMCSDGASVNVKLHRLVQEELGSHYTLILCPSHKVELAIGDAFKLSGLNSQCQEDVTMFTISSRKLHCAGVYSSTKHSAMKFPICDTSVLQELVGPSTKRRH